MYPIPVADFNWSPQNPGHLQESLSIFDQSQQAVEWYFDGPLGESLDAEFTLEMPPPGNYPVSLIVHNAQNCSDTIQQIIEVSREYTYFLPNAFTPNGDGINDVFVGVGFVEGITSFQLSIFDRWGALVFKAYQPRFGWDGRFQNEENTLLPGVYNYKLSFKTPEGKTVNQNGQVVLLR